MNGAWACALNQYGPTAMLLEPAFLLCVHASSYVEAGEPCNRPFGEARSSLRATSVFLCCSAISAPTQSAISWRALTQFDTNEKRATPHACTAVAEPYSMRRHQTPFVATTDRIILHSSSREEDSRCYLGGMVTAIQNWLDACLDSIHALGRVVRLRLFDDDQKDSAPASSRGHHIPR